MANGYVPPPFARPQQHPFFPQRRFGAPFPFPPPQPRALHPQGRSPNPRPNPSQLFSPSNLQGQGQGQGQGGDAQCLFPNAFPEHGPNIFQRFWIRLFHFLLTPVYLLLEVGSALRKIYERAEVDLDAAMLTRFVCENSWSILIGLVVVVTLCVLAWFFSPKGENNTVWRSTLILTCASCYIMWAITFLAQWHPLIQPKVTKLRPGYEGMS